MHRTGLTIRGAHTKVRRGPFSYTRTQDFLSRGALFFSTKVDDLFSRQRTSTQRDKIKWQLIGGPCRRGGGGSHGTTDTKDNPAMHTTQRHSYVFKVFTIITQHMQRLFLFIIDTLLTN